jgi:hypothetical protein
MARIRSRRDSRRRRRRLLPIAGFVFAAVGLAWLLESRMPTTIIIVRHADVDVFAGVSDPPLNERGHRRAQLLADVLEAVDVLRGVDVIYASSHTSARQTAAPLAGRLDLDVNLAELDPLDPFVDRLRDNHGGRIVLVVVPGELIAPVIAGLSGHQSVPEIAADEYENIYIVTRPRFGKVKTLRLLYGLPWPGGEPRPAASQR